MKHAMYFVISLSLLPIVSLFFSSGLPHTSDGAMHLVRFGSYYNEIMNGQFPVRWASDLNYGYGTPIFNFFHPLPYLLAFPFVAAGLGLVVTLKILFVISYVLAGIFMYFFIRELLGDEKKAFLVTVFYQFAPFRLVEMLTRGSLGGLFSYALLPLLLWGIVLLIKKTGYRSFLLVSISSALLIMSHNIVGFVFFLVSGLFVLFFCRSVNKILVCFTAMISGLLLSSFYLLPAVLEHKFTYGYLFTKDLFYAHFAPIQNFFLPNFFNVESLRVAEVSVQFGLFHVLSVILATIFLLRKKSLSTTTKRILIFSLLLIVITLFFMQKTSLFFWEHISLLRQFQYPWRLLAVICFATAFTSLSFAALPFLKKKVWFVLLIALTVGSSAFYWYPPQGFQTINEKDYWNYPLTTNYFGEVDTIWAEGPAKSYPKKRVEIISGKGIIDGLVKKSTKQHFTLTAQSDVTIVSKTMFFPGWKVFVDGVSVPIQFQDQNWRGMITFTVPSGKHDVVVRFDQSKLQQVGNLISLLSVIALSLGIFIARKKQMI